MLRPVRKTAPAAMPVTVPEVKANSRISGTVDDVLIGALIASAVDHLDGWSGILGRCLIEQVWTYSLRSWPAYGVALPFPDVSSVVVKYRDENDTEQTFVGSNYRLVEGASGTEVEWVDGFSAPSMTKRSDAISIEMTVGYGADATFVPPAIKQAILLLVGHWYENRETVVVGTIVADLPFAVKALLAPHSRKEI